MLLLTTGPHLYYVDPEKMILKGQIPWSSALLTEPKNFKTFFVHTVSYFPEKSEHHLFSSIIIVSIVETPRF